jgi:hypothetical protein
MSVMPSLIRERSSLMMSKRGATSSLLDAIEVASSGPSQRFGGSERIGLIFTITRADESASHATNFEPRSRRGNNRERQCADVTVKAFVMKLALPLVLDHADVANFKLTTLR